MGTMIDFLITFGCAFALGAFFAAASIACLREDAENKKHKKEREEEK